MTDLVERLREIARQKASDACKGVTDPDLMTYADHFPEWEAASEITRLRSADVKRVEDICRLTQERDEARSALSVSQAEKEVMRVELEKANIELAALVGDPERPNFAPATQRGNEADQECLGRAFAAIRAALQSYRDTRREMIKR